MQNYQSKLVPELLDLGNPELLPQNMDRKPLLTYGADLWV